jgi:hypothetical protein
VNYKIDELLISLVPAGALGRLGDNLGCTGDTCGGHGSGCDACSECSQCGTDSQKFDFDDIVDPEPFERLRTRLRIALAQLDARAPAVEQHVRPRSQVEVTILEQKLNAVMKTLREHA